MLKNYLKIAIRTLSRHKLFSFINIFGLALSMSVCMIVMIRIKDQLSYDSFHPYANRTYRILSEVSNKKGDKFMLASTPLPLKAYLDKAVEDAVQLYPAVNEKASSDGKQLALNGAFTGPSFFNIFGFELLAGNKKAALQAPNSIVLSHDAAVKFFGSGNAVGKVLSFEKIGDLVVTGVLSKNSKSHIDYDAYISIATVPQLEKNGKLPAKLSNWDSFEQGYTYVLLKNNASVSELNNSLAQVAALINKDSKEASFGFKAQFLKDITPASQELMNDIGGGSGWSKLWAEIGIALIILIAACFNYTNLTIARALTRAKEAGIRKVAGAVRHQLFTQYIVESIVIALFALGLGTLFLQLILQYQPFNDGYEMVPAVNLEMKILLWFVLFAVITGAVAGAMPAWILSAFKPVEVLKNLSTQKLFGNLTLQKTLIVFQFSLSLVIIIFLSAFYRQFTYLGSADNGFRTENVLTVSLNGADHKLFANEAVRIAGVEQIAPLSTNFGREATGTMYASVEKGTQPLQLQYYFTDAGLLQTMGLKLIGGTNFPGAQEQYILLNEKAAQGFGFKNTADAVGKSIWINDSTQLQITGIVKDFYYAGAGRSIGPMALRQHAGSYDVVNISVTAANKDKLVAQVEAAWVKTNPGKPFTYFWLDKQLRAMNSQRATISLLGFLAFMTITIACLGLLGLVIYTVETKRKEISIRKVIGAEVQQLMLLLSRGFIKLLMIAGLIAMPVGYVLSFIFLQAFAKRIDLGLSWLLLCFGFLLMVGLFTILSQTYRASIANPVKSLKND